MADGLKEASRFTGWRYVVWAFIKTQLSPHMANLVDFLVIVLLVKLSRLFHLYATFSGPVVGGMVNYAINYGWVFHANDCEKTYVTLRYLFVWGGSTLLNIRGTSALIEWLADMRWVDGLLGHYMNGVFILSKIIVAVSVTFFWNYHLQRIFVHRNYNFRKLT